MQTLSISSLSQSLHPDHNKQTHERRVNIKDGQKENGFFIFWVGSFKFKVNVRTCNSPVEQHQSERLLKAGRGLTVSVTWRHEAGCTGFMMGRASVFKQQGVITEWHISPCFNHFLTEKVNYLLCKLQLRLFYIKTSWKETNKTAILSFFL